MCVHVPVCSYIIFTRMLAIFSFVVASYVMSDPNIKTTVIVLSSICVNIN